MTEEINRQVYSISKIIDEYFQYKNNKSSGNRSYSVYHPSAFGKCLRKMQYQRYASHGYIDSPKVTNDSRMIRIWDTGHSLHSRWAKYMEDLGILRGVWTCSNPECLKVYGKDNLIGDFKPEECISCKLKDFNYDEITVDDKSINFHGHCDQILDFSKLDKNFLSWAGEKWGGDVFSNNIPNKPIVVDMKSINKSQWSKIQHEPHFYYVVQITIYIHILNLDYGLIIYENKDDSDIRIFKVLKNEDLWSAIRRQAEIMNKMFEKKSLPPPRPSSKNSFECRFCEFSNICHVSNVWDVDNLNELRSKFYNFDINYGD
jgi:CRISPR/Cas system-associated exonuclease Cas4 (RecB family)